MATPNSSVDRDAALARLIALAELNQTQPCPGNGSGAMTLEYPGPGRFTPIHGALCCNGTGRIPRPAAVELLEALTVECAHPNSAWRDTAFSVAFCPTCGLEWRLEPGHYEPDEKRRVPRAYAEARCAAEDWAHDEAWTILHAMVPPYFVIERGIREKGTADTFWEALAAALVASGWTALKEAKA